MLSRRMGLMGFAAVAALAMSSISPAAAAAVSPKAVMTQAGRRFEMHRVNLWGGVGGWETGRRFRHGWSSRHVQRMATKKRNQARNRRAHRG